MITKGQESLHNFGKELVNRLFTKSADITDADDFLTNDIGLESIQDKYGGDIEWKLTGDDPSNWQTATANNDSALQALFEKDQNSIDAVIMKQCYDNNIDPTSRNAPQSPEDAVELFYGIKDCDWGSVDRDQYNDILKVLENNETSEKNSPNPNISIIDRGCGVEPDFVKTTFLDNKNSNKISIKCVGGKFSAGGWAVFNHLRGANSDTHGGIQAIITKACPSHQSGSKFSNNFSVIVTRLFSPTELDKYNIIPKAKLPAICHITFNGEVPNFPAESICTDHGNIKGKLLSARNEGWDSMEYGTWVRLFNYDINYKRPITKNLKDIVNLGHATKNGFPKVSYPITGHQPLKDKKFKKYHSFTKGLIANPTMDAYGLKSLLNYDANTQSSRNSQKFYRNDVYIDGRKEYNYPIVSTITDPSVGSCKMSTWILSDPKKDENGKVGAYSHGGQRGIYHSIGSQFQQIETNTEREWQTGCAHKNVISIIEYDGCNHDVQARISGVDRSAFRNESILSDMRELQIAEISECKPLKKLKEEKSSQGVNDFKGMIDEYFGQTFVKQAKGKGNGICSPTKKKGNCDPNIPNNDTADLRDDKITQAKLKPNQFQAFYNKDTNDSTLFKEVNIEANGYRIFIHTDGSNDYFDNLKGDYGITHEESAFDEDVWTLSNRACKVNHNDGILSLNFKLDKNSAEKYKQRVRFKSAGKEFVLEWNCKKYSKPQSLTTSTSNNRNVSDFANPRKNKGKKVDIVFKSITKSEVGDYKTHYDSKLDDANIEMTEHDLVGFQVDKESCIYAVNIDHPDFIKSYRKISKDLRAKGIEKDNLDQFVEQEFLCLYRNTLRQHESSIQHHLALHNKDREHRVVINTGFLSHTITKVEALHLESFMIQRLPEITKGAIVS